ncbi:hypothetical protein ACR6HW_12345 [Fusibacter sp. JL298sf-3]
MVGKVEEIMINGTGYEAILLMDFEELGKIYCSVMLDHEHDPAKSYDIIEVYFEDNPSMKLEVGSILNSTLNVNYGNDIRVADSRKKGYVQNIEKSPHGLFTCRVLEVLEDDMLVCDLGSVLNEVKAEFEESTEKIALGDMICFSGEFVLTLN